MLKLIFTSTLALAFCCKTIAQSDYDAISDSKINLNGVRIDKVDDVLQILGKPKNEKTYTPPEGDTEEYDKIHYYNYDSARLTVYRLEGHRRLSTFDFTSKQLHLSIDDTLISVGSPVSALQRFTTSFEEFRKSQTANTKTDINNFYLAIKPSGGRGQGIMNFTVQGDIIVGISLSFDPA